jgi:hypothetical protein
VSSILALRIARSALPENANTRMTAPARNSSDTPWSSAAMLPDLSATTVVCLPYGPRKGDKLTLSSWSLRFHIIPPQPRTTFSGAVLLEYPEIRSGNRPACGPMAGGYCGFRQPGRRGA